MLLSCLFHGQNALLKRTIEMHKCLYECYNRLQKAFDKVQHEGILEILENLDLHGNDI